MLREIIKYGRPELVRKSDPVGEFDGQLRQLAQDMFETLYQAEGVGLAAPQVAVNIRLAVVDITAGREDGNQIVLINPEIAEREGSQVGEEGCLSIPGFTTNLERPNRIRLKAQGLDGKPFEMEAEEFLARVICHEVDHLDGILYIDHLSALKRDMIKRKIRKMVKAGEW